MQSKRDFPQDSMRNGLIDGTKCQSSERKGNLFQLLCIASTTGGSAVMKRSLKLSEKRWKKFVDFTHNQIDELMTDYGKVDILWLDGGWVRKKTDEEVKAELLDVYDNSRWFRNPQSQDINMAEIVRKSRLKQSQLIVVDRAVPGEQQNYLTPEQHIPETGLPYPWETCMTMANSWSYVPNDQYKSANELIEKLVDIVSKGGNYLLNIAPSPDGEFDVTAYERLKEIGNWIKINGEVHCHTPATTDSAWKQE
mgnify:CR=1 FL=1